MGDTIIMFEIQHSPGPPNPITEADSDCKIIDANQFNFIHLDDDIFTRFTNLETLILNNCSIYNLPSSIYNIRTLKILDIS